MSTAVHTPRTSSTTEVVVVGAGPVGLWVAHELALAGVSVTVLERDEQPSTQSRALGIQPRTVEVLALRGRHREVLAGGHTVPNWHFGMLSSRVDLRSLPTPFPFLLAQPQAVTQALLEGFAAEYGVAVRRGHHVTSLTQRESSVTVQVEGPTGPYRMEAAYVVGADGAGSTVRREAGIAFPGTGTTAYGFLGEVTLDEPPRTPGFAVVNETGRLLVVPLPNGLFRVTGYDPLNQGREPLSFEELRATSLRVAGTDFGMRDPVWLSRFGNATRVAADYRERGILLAGDAAHINWPAGGVGLNVGMQDAMNLGWKLAAVVQGRAGQDLLDSYHAERHPVGVELNQHTLAQTALIVGLTPETTALRDLLAQAIAGTPAFSDLLANKLSGLDIAYRSDDPDAHPLTGFRAHDPEGEGVFRLLHDGRAVLLTLDDAPLDREVVGAALRAGLRVHPSGLARTGGPAWAHVTAALIRPDGRVWWATEQDVRSPEFVADIHGALDALPAVFPDLSGVVDH